MFLVAAGVCCNVSQALPWLFRFSNAWSGIFTATAFRCVIAKGITLPFLVKMSVPWSLMHKAYMASLAGWKRAGLMLLLRSITFSQWTRSQKALIKFRSLFIVWKKETKILVRLNQTISGIPGPPCNLLRWTYEFVAFSDRKHSVCYFPKERIFFRSVDCFREVFSTRL